MAEKTAPEGGDVDLFGEPWTPPKDPRGRKGHQRTVQLSEKISLLRATGASKEEIAELVCLSVKTIEKYYSRELNEGPALAKALVDQIMFRKALGGNVSAAKYVQGRFKDGDASLAQQRVKARAEAATDVGSQRPAPVERIGKKAERQAAAEELANTGGKFAPPAAPGRPKLVASRP
jgi:hypothetical protein